MGDICGVKFQGDPADVWGTGACCCQWYRRMPAFVKLTLGFRALLWSWQGLCLKVTLGLWSCDHWHLFWSQSILETQKIWTKMKRRCKKRYPQHLPLGNVVYPFPTLYRIGESPGLGDWSLVCIFDVESSRSIKVKKRRDGRCLIVCWFASKWRNNKLFPGYWHWCRKVM